MTAKTDETIIKKTVGDKTEGTGKGKRKKKMSISSHAD